MIYTLNLIPTYGVETILNCSQYDTRLRAFSLELYEGNAKYEIPLNALITVRGTKEDETAFEYALVYDSEGIINLPLTAQMTLYAGIVPCELRIVKDGELLGTANFVLDIEETPFNEDAPVSETDIPLLEEAEQHAAIAAQSAQQARYSEEEAAKWAAQAREDAEDIDEKINAIHIDAEQTDYGALITTQDLTHRTQVEIYHGYDGKDGKGLYAYYDNETLFIQALLDAEEVDW